MNNVFLPNLSVNATQITGISTPFSTATFYSVSGFSAQGVPTANSGKLYIGPVSGKAGITINAGSTLTINADVNTPTNSTESLSNYYVTPQYAYDGTYILYS